MPTSLHCPLLLSDPMTDAVFTTSEQVEVLFAAHEPAPVVSMPLA